MKTKAILFSVGLLVTLAFFSFKNKSGEAGTSKAVIVSLMNGKGDNEGFIITYGDGTIEKRPFKVKIMDPDNWVEIQMKAAVVVNEMKEKGYHYVGSHVAMVNWMIFEK